LYKDPLRCQELLENAVDAKATDIKLVIKDAGKALVQVIDNGLGMSVTDARLCFEPYIKNTSLRIYFFAYQRISCEALASIAAIAHGDEDQTRPEELGTQIIVEGVSLYPKTWRYCRKALHLRSKSFFNIPTS
jgi:DNA mismatch repair protein MutL